MATYSETDYSEPKSSAEIQREIELQRSRVENTIDQIQERLSPGQIVDELLSYTKQGGAEFAANLGRTAASNPLPVALLGVSLAWLMAGPKTSTVTNWFARDERRPRSRPARSASAYNDAFDEELDGFDDSLDDAFDDELEYAYAPIQGDSLRRSTTGTDDRSGSLYTEFVDDAGKKFRATTDKAGNRAGHFIDDAGNTFRGFTDAAGNRIQKFRDEAGDVISDAAGWASEKWDQGRRALHDARDSVSRGAASVSRGVSRGAGSVSGGVASGVSALSSGVSGAGRTAAQAGRSVSRAGATAGRKVAEVGSAVGQQGAVAARRTVDVLQDQPLVTGALAFAVGAAVAALLPHTDKEDELLGEKADAVRAEAGRKAAEAYEAGKEKVATLYGQATDKAADLYHQATDKAGEAYEQARSTVASQAENLSKAADAAKSSFDTAGSEAKPARDEYAFDDRAGAGPREEGRNI